MIFRKKTNDFYQNKINVKSFAAASSWAKLLACNAKN
jgi:hypothetical protein